MFRHVIDLIIDYTDYVYVSSSIISDSIVCCDDVNLMKDWVKLLESILIVCMNKLYCL